MRAVVTRVKHASVTIENEIHGQIGQGYLVLLGVGPSDTEEISVKLADKICNLRVFEDAITFKIALMVVNYMKYIDSLE